MIIGAVVRVGAVARRNSHLRSTDAYDFYLRVELQRKPNTIIGIVTKVRRMIKFAISEGIITRDPFDGYAPERPTAIQKYLTREELDKIMNTPSTTRTGILHGICFCFPALRD